MPFSAQSFALFIRSDWREAVGAGVPTTWGEMDALAEAFTTGDPDGNGEDDTHGYAVPGSTKRGYTSWYLSSFLWSGGGGFLDGEPGAFTPAVDSPESVEVLEWFQHTFCDGLVAPGAVTAETSQTHPVFYGGQAGIYFTGPYMMGVFDADLGAEKYEIVPLPAGEGGEAVSLAEGENVYLMAGSENQEGQERFAEFAASVEGQTIGMAGDTDGTIVRLPVNATVDMAEVRTDERWQTFQQIYQESGRYVPNVPEWTPFRQMAAETFNTVASDCEADPAAELGGLADEFAEELEGQERPADDVDRNRRPAGGTGPGGAAAAPPGPGAGRLRRTRFRDPAAALLLLLPALVIFTLFKFIPMGRAVQMSLFEVRPYLGDRWVGMDNYRHVLTDPDFLDAMWHTAVIAVTQTAGAMLLGLVIALLLEGTARHLWFVRTAVFLPTIVTMAVVAEVWRVLYYPAPDGVVNSVLAWIGLGPSQFLNSADTSLSSVIAVGIWRHAPTT
ncbi:hypothetical protein GCM10029992_54680 [Glycomyces albus]